jgi:phospholipase/lecithinase/hemolysin
MRRAVLRSLASLVLVATFVLGGPLQASPISGIFFLGDSLTDMGNAALLNSPPGADSTSSPPARSPVPYPLAGADGFVYTPVYVPPWTRPYETTGRFTDGATWANAFASAFGFPGAAAPSGAGGNNYAVGGATVVPFGGLGSPPSAVEQLALFRSTHGGGSGTFDPTALYFIGAGGNDLRAILTGTPGASPAGIVGGLTSMVTDLRSWGAERIVLWTLPDLTLSPSFLAALGLGLISPAERDAFLALIDGLNGVIASFDALPGVDVFDLAGLLRDIAGDPGAYGLADVTTPCGFAGVYVPTGGTCTDTFLFWDGAHPTSAGHAILARSMIALVPEPDSAWLLGAALLALAFRRRVRS